MKETLTAKALFLLIIFRSSLMSQSSNKYGICESWVGLRRLSPFVYPLEPGGSVIKKPIRLQLRLNNLFIFLPAGSLTLRLSFLVGACLWSMESATSSKPRRSASTTFCFSSNSPMSCSLRNCCWSSKSRTAAIFSATNSRSAISDS